MCLIASLPCNYCNNLYNKGVKANHWDLAAFHTHLARVQLVTEKHRAVEFHLLSIRIHALTIEIHPLGEGKHLFKTAGNIKTSDTVILHHI